jgi:hypothetical protein
MVGGGWWYFLDMLMNGKRKWQGRRQKEDNKVFGKGGVGRKRKEERFTIELETKRKRQRQRKQ